MITKVWIAGEAYREGGLVEALPGLGKKERKQAERQEERAGFIHVFKALSM